MSMSLFFSKSSLTSNPESPARSRHAIGFVHISQFPFHAWGAIGATGEPQTILTFFWMTSNLQRHQVLTGFQTVSAESKQMLTFTLGEQIAVEEEPYLSGTRESVQADWWCGILKENRGNAGKPKGQHHAHRGL